MNNSSDFSTMASSSSTMLEDLELIDPNTDDRASGSPSPSLLPDAEPMDVDSSVPTIHQLLSYPSQDSSTNTDSHSDGHAGHAHHQQQQPRTFLKDRLYIGNLHPSVDEYALLSIFNKFGKVTKLDYLFHKSGPLKGKPRGYAFVEYGNPEEAQKALSKAHAKLLRGRKLTVTYAQQAPLEHYPASTAYSHKKTPTESSRPTTLSMIKTGYSSRHEPKTADKIAVMEAKLRQIEASRPPDPNRPTTQVTPTSSLPHHPSLPAKPPPPLPAHIARALQASSSHPLSNSSSPSSSHHSHQSLNPQHTSGTARQSSNSSSKNPLPSLPLKPNIHHLPSLPLKPPPPSSATHTLPLRPSHPMSTSMSSSSSSRPASSSSIPTVNTAGLPSKQPKQKLAGVIIKPKNKTIIH
ncbi:hypothetical protein FA15DRAFT_619793 [Coprinopsis marcescibilis]|uniref:Probable RNA-binding protein 18 n=1 Tax=Coprinopsis marcescibilis TaxID=230819 RepID=A0A5C3KUJ4_COPMA|nr:hypothetical protein FA15DRAFT_619793 [Coprinopsis marcescibilis]